MEPIPGLTESDWLLAESLSGFTSEYLLNRYDQPKPVPWFHLEWWALFLSSHPQCAIAAPRNHSKSTAITFAYILFLLAFRTTRHLLILGSNETNASAFSNEIKIELIENDPLREYMGFAKFDKETETELIIKFKDGTRSRIISRGTDQKIRGLKWERKRPDLVLADDMEDSDTVLNEQRRKKFRDNFYGAVKPLLNRGGRIRAVGTIVGFDSFLENCMPDEKKPSTIIEPLRTYSNDPGSWVSVKYRAHNPDFTEMLWPEQFNKDWFIRERQDYAERGILDIYGQEYLNNPIDETTAYFRKTDLLPMSDLDKEKKMTYYAAADFAIGETERSAFTVIIVGGMDSDGFLHIVDVRRGRWDGLEIIEEMFSVQAAYEPESFRVESENIAKSLGSFIYKKMDEDQVYINLDDQPPTKDKDKRARSIQARTRARKVKFDKEADWYPDFEDEITKYPKYAYKDQFDAFAWLGLMLDDMVEPSTDAEEEEAMYQRAYRDHMPQGRNVTTGY